MEVNGRRQTWAFHQELSINVVPTNCQMLSVSVSVFQSISYTTHDGNVLSNFLMDCVLKEVFKVSTD